MNHPDPEVTPVCVLTCITVTDTMAACRHHSPLPKVYEGGMPAHHHGFGDGCARAAPAPQPPCLDCGHRCLRSTVRAAGRLRPFADDPCPRRGSPMDDTTLARYQFKRALEEI